MSYVPRFPPRQITIEIDSDVYFKLMKECKQDEALVKKTLQDDIDFIHNHFRQLANHEQGRKEVNGYEHDSAD